MDERQLIKSHKISLNNRLCASMTGVREVIAFDAGEILVDTEQGVLMIKGEELHITRLSLEKGEMELNGKIDGLMYSEQENKKKEGLWARLFQ